MPPFQGTSSSEDKPAFGLSSSDMFHPNPVLSQSSMLSTHSHPAAAAAAAASSSSSMVPPPPSMATPAQMMMQAPSVGRMMPPSSQANFVQSQAAAAAGGASMLQGSVQTWQHLKQRDPHHRT